VYERIRNDKIDADASDEYDDPHPKRVSNEMTAVGNGQIVARIAEMGGGGAKSCF